MSGKTTDRQDQKDCETMKSLVVNVTKAVGHEAADALNQLMDYLFLRTSMKAEVKQRWKETGILRPDGKVVIMTKKSNASRDDMTLALIHMGSAYQYGFVLDPA